MLDSLDFSFVAETRYRTLYCCTKSPFISLITTRGSYLGGWIHVNADNVQLGFRRSQTTTE